MMYRRRSGEDVVRLGIPREGLDMKKPEEGVRKALLRLGYTFDSCEIGDPYDMFGSDGPVYYDVVFEGRRRMRTGK